MSRPLISHYRRTRWSAVLACLWIVVWVPALAADPRAARSDTGMVVTPEELATRAGVEVLADGGTATDAAVAVAFVLAVTAPQSGSLGGGGFALIRDEHGDHSALDFRETAPRGLTAGHFLDEAGQPIRGLSLESGLAVGTPGLVEGLITLHTRSGKLPWKRLLEPAIRHAEQGFPVYPYLAFAFEDAQRRIRLSEAASRVLLIDAGTPREGDILRQPDLAATLRKIAKHGRAGFYEGPVADAIVSAVRERGGVLSATDLNDYRSVDREPLRGSYRGFEVVAFPPPSSGGVALLQMLTMLESYDLSGAYGSSLGIHLMTEIQRRAFADRSEWLGDPDHIDVPVEELLSPAYLDSRKRSIRGDRATPSEVIRPGAPVERDHETHHFCVADADGRVVAMTTTLNTNFGSGIMAAGTGVLLNNEIDDFALAPGVPNVYGLVGGDANAVAPLRRPLSSMTPTIIEYSDNRKRPYLVLGSPGGGRIINAVLQVIVNVIDHGMHLQEAVHAPRTHHQWLPDLLYFEPRALSTDVRRGLERRGHELKQRDRIGNVHAIGTDEVGVWLGAADPRRGGLAAGPP